MPQSILSNWVQSDVETLITPKSPKPDKQAKVLFRQGSELWNQGQYAEAIAAYDQAVQLQPDYVEAWYYRGFGLEELRHYEQALASYDEVIRLDPLHQYVWCRRGIVLLTRLQRYDEAFASYNKVIEIEPNNYEAWYGRGDALIELKRYPEAVTSYKEAIHINPTNCFDWCERVQKLQELKLEQQALSLCKELATDLEKMAAQVAEEYYLVWDSIHQNWCMLGACLLGLKCYTEAVSACDKAIQIKQDEILDWYCRGNALEELQRYKEAANCYDKVIQIQPNFEEATKGRERVLRKVKK